MEIMNRPEGYATLLINESIKLEMSNCHSINNYMVQTHGIDWNENQVYQAIADDLEKTMKLEKVENDGHIINQWIDRY